MITITPNEDLIDPPMQDKHIKQWDDEGKRAGKHERVTGEWGDP